MEIRLAQVQDIDAWMILVEQVRDAFPGLETAQAMAEHRKNVLRFVQKTSAVCAVDGGRVLGGLLFSRENGMLCFLAVSPACRRQHIGRKLVQFMLTQMEEWENITVTTYRDGDPNGKAARSFYKCLGFSEGKLAEEFGCPVQEFVLRRTTTGQI